MKNVSGIAPTRRSNFTLSRRGLLSLAGASAAALGAMSLTSAAPVAAQTSGAWDKTFAKSDRVDHQKVTFKNRYGITLVGDLYLPKNRGNGRLPAIAVGGPFGAVKEQSSGLYAQTMAERGFVTLAFDPSYPGESGGTPRNVASPDINTEDFSAVVDFLGRHASVDRERIGVLGICGWGGMALNAVAVDKRVKAVAVSTMYDMSRVMSRGYNDKTTLEAHQDARATQPPALGRCRRWRPGIRPADEHPEGRRSAVLGRLPRLLKNAPWLPPPGGELERVMDGN